MYILPPDYFIPSGCRERDAVTGTGRIGLPSGYLGNAGVFTELHALKAHVNLLGTVVAFLFIRWMNV